MNARILPNGSNDAALDIIERQRFTKHVDDAGVIERANKISEFLLDLTDRSYRVVLQHDRGSFGVVEIEPKRELFVAIQSSNVSTLQLLQIAVQSVPVTGSDLSVLDSIDTSGTGDQIALQERIPRRMIDRELRIGIVSFENRVNQ